MDRAGCWAIFHGDIKTWAQMSAHAHTHTHTHTHTHIVEIYLLTISDINDAFEIRKLHKVIWFYFVKIITAWKPALHYVRAPLVMWKNISTLLMLVTTQGGLRRQYQFFFLYTFLHVFIFLVTSPDAMRKYDFCEAITLIEKIIKNIHSIFFSFKVLDIVRWQQSGYRFWRKTQHYPSKRAYQL